MHDYEERTAKLELDTRQTFPLHNESTGLVRAPIDRVFARLDDPMSLSAHMGESSMMMMGSRMSMEIDDGGGRVVGSIISMHGRVMGLAVSLDEVITERQPPYLKIWETTDIPRLLVIAQYRMGFDLTPRGDSTLLRVFINYSLPTKAPQSWLGRLFGSFYARWCTAQIVADATRHFNNR